MSIGPGALRPVAPFVPLAPLVATAPFVVAPLVGDELKNKGDDEGTLFCPEARGVASDPFGCAVRLLRVDRAGVPNVELRCDLREAGEDMLV